MYFLLSKWYRMNSNRLRRCRCGCAQSECSFILDAIAYHDAFRLLEDKGWQRPIVPGHRTHNAHMYYLIVPSANARVEFMVVLKARGVQAVSHYEPLHASPMGLSMGYRAEDLPLSMDFAARLVRLPLWAGMGEAEIVCVVDAALTNT